MNASMTPGSLYAGFSTGLRTFTALAITLADGKSPWTGLVGTLAAGELIGDKLPATPNRTAPLGLVGRIVTGAGCGALVAARKNGSKTLGAILGAVGALAGTFAGFGLRTTCTSTLGTPDPLVAVIEDAVAFGLARAAIA